MKNTIVILCGGGPAPGINTVIGSVAKIFLQDNYRVLGMHEGYKTLFTSNPRYVEIDYPMPTTYTRPGDLLYR